MIIFFFIIITKDTWLKILNLIKQILLPIIISFTIAYCLDTFVKVINKKIKNNSLSIIIILLITIIIIITSLYFSLPILSTQLINLFDEIIPFINNIFDKTYLLNYKLLENLIINNLNSFITMINNNTIAIVIKSFNIMSNIVIIFILTIYILFKIDSIKYKIKTYFLSKKKVLLTLKNIDMSLNKYLKSLCLIIIIEIIEYSFIYFIIGHPNYLLIGFLAGITTFIPYFGGLFTNVVALITALNISNNLFLICSVIVIICPIIDAYIIDPKIYHKQIKINPLETIISIVVCSTLFGIFGVVIAVPLYIVVVEIFKVYKPKI